MTLYKGKLLNQNKCKNEMRKIAGNILLVLVAFALSVVTCEKYLELQHYKSIVNLLSDRFILKLKLLQAGNTSYFTPSENLLNIDSFHLEPKKYHYKTDSNGCIVTDLNSPNPDISIAFFGGSTAQCLLVDEDKRLPEAFGRHLEFLSKKRINVYNAAAGGSHSQHTLNVLTNNFFEKHIDYAFFYVNLNDIGLLAHYGRYNAKNPQKGIFFDVRRYEESIIGKQKITFFKYTQHKLNSAFRSLEQDEFEDVRGQPLITDSAIIFKEIEKALLQIVAVCEARQIIPVFVTEVNCMSKLELSWYSKNMPVFKATDTEYSRFLNLINQHNRFIKNFCANKNIQVIDMEDFPVAFEYFYDAVHFNSIGAEKFAKSAAEKFYMTSNYTNTQTSNQQPNVD